MARAATANFVVVHLADTDRWGFDEVTLPMLVRLVDASGADDREFTHLGVTAYWVASARALGETERLVAAAEALRDGDPRFRSLGIGVAHGRLLAEFDRKGRLTRRSPPLGTTANGALQMSETPRAYREALEALRRVASAGEGLRPDARG